MLYRYAPDWYEDLVSPDSVDGREHERKLALDRPTRRLIQHGLANDGFDPGTPDGQFGPRTRAAIRAWQAARGTAITGYVDEVQAELLLRRAAARQSETEAATTVADWLDLWLDLAEEAAIREEREGSEFFTRGSHQDEVLRLQGTPDSITALFDSEVWSYGSSSVTISTRSREVTQWSNLDGKLRVRLVPRPPSSGPPRSAEPAPGAVFRPGNGISPPRLLREVKPQYTAEAMRAKIQGTVWLEVVVLPDGTVGDIRITKSLDPVFGLDQQAIDAARQWRFAPGTRFGEPVPVLVGLELYFNLR